MRLPAGQCIRASQVTAAGRGTPNSPRGRVYRGAQVLPATWGTNSRPAPVRPMPKQNAPAGLTFPQLAHYDPSPMHLLPAGDRTTPSPDGGRYPVPHAATGPLNTRPAMTDSPPVILAPAGSYFPCVLRVSASESIPTQGNLPIPGGHNGSCTQMVPAAGAQVARWATHPRVIHDKAPGGYPKFPTWPEDIRRPIPRRHVGALLAGGLRPVVSPNQNAASAIAARRHPTPGTRKPARWAPNSDRPANVAATPGFRPSAGRTLIPGRVAEREPTTCRKSPPDLARKDTP